MTLAAWALCLLGPGGVLPLPAQTASDIVPTLHNLSTSAPPRTPPLAPPLKAETESRICIFCHTPHNATPESPLWNKELDANVYDVYTSDTMQTEVEQPTGATKLCLSCHDGTIALGAVVNPSSGIAMISGSSGIPTSTLSNFGLDLRGHHPVSFNYNNSLPNPDLVPTPPEELVFGADDEVHCTTCHDPHNDTYGKFLVKDNEFSALCTTCHQIVGWNTSAHATSTASVAGVLPLAPKTWPTWTQLDQWGCESCHTPHFAPTPEQLLNFTSAPPEPFSCVSSGCHSDTSNPPHTTSAPGLLPLAASGSGMPRTDIARQVEKPSAHRSRQEFTIASRRVAGGAAATGVSDVTCWDCHNPHLVNERAADPPFASGLLEGVSGIDRQGSPLEAVTYEYEVCLKCHGDDAADAEFVPRYVASNNTRTDFDSANPSYHPVVAMGKELDVPSIPSSLSPSLQPMDQIYCSSCHADDSGNSNGPHGSSYPPILRERYETADGTPESYENYALCYRCHEQSSILADASFVKKAIPTTPSGGGHSGHLAAGAPCAACHDPHGINDELAGSDTGDHTHLINFDSAIVQPLGTALEPLFEDTGTHSGNCTLVCHGVTHDAISSSYP